MKEKIEKIYNISVATIVSIYALIELILLIFLPKYNILFPGWWTFIIMLPAFGNLLFQNNKASSLYIFIIGLMLFLVSLEIINLNKCFTILLCLGIIFIGISIIKTTLKIPEKKKSIIKYVPFYYTCLGSTEEKITTTFVGGTTKVIVGYLLLDLRDAKIEDNSTLKVSSIFGTTEIYLPENVEVVTNNTNILGGTENLKLPKEKSNKKKKKIYVESISIFGSTKLR